MAVRHSANSSLFFICLFICSSFAGRVLQEITLTESIRYADCDPVERWLSDLLCLNAGNIPRITSGCPVPDQCDLYYVNRDTLFSYHKASESFLHRIMGLYVSSHYKVSNGILKNTSLLWFEDWKLIMH